MDNWHYGYVAELWEAVVLGQILRLIINTPPRTGKSNELTIAGPAHTWTERPWTRFITASHNKDLSTKHSTDRRNLMTSPFYQQRWGEVWSFADDQDAKSHYQNTSMGTMLARSVEGASTGFGADILLLDDLINPFEAESKAARESAHLSYDVNLKSRLNDPRRSAIVIVEQRTHADDMTGHVQKQEAWTKVELPAEFKKRRVYSFPISKAEVVCEVGDVLQAIRIPMDILVKERKKGTRTYNAQQLQEPDDEKGKIVQRQWFRFYDEDPREKVKQMVFVGQSWDMSFVKSEGASHVCGLVGGWMLDGNKILLDESRDQRNYPESKREIRRFSKEWPTAVYKWVENKANGPAIVDDMSNGTATEPAISGMISVPPAIGDKTARLVRASACIESGNFLLPNPYLRDANGYRPDRHDENWPENLVNPRFAWVIAYIDELAVFPKEPNDRGDATSQLIVMLDGVPLDMRGGAPEPEENGNLFGVPAILDPFGNLRPFGHPNQEEEEVNIFHDGGSIFDV